MLKYILTLILILVISLSAPSQSMGKRWMIISETKDNVVYIDTSKLESVNNQLSVWSLLFNRHAKVVNPFQQLVSRIKTNFLFNTVTNKYAVIGTLYYDEKGRIIGESTSPKMTGGGDNFMMPIQEGTMIELVEKKALEFVSTGKVSSEPSDYTPEQIAENDTQAEGNNSSNPDSAASAYNADNAADVKPDNIPDNNNSSAAELNKDGYPAAAGESDTDVTVIDENALDTYEKPAEEETPADTLAVNSGVTPPAENVESKPETQTQKEEDIQNDGEYVYNSDNEKQAAGLFFTDGVKYCFQVASFRTRSVAEREVEKLRRKGHNAFIVKTYIPQKRATYNRIRIGFFDTLKEAKKYKRNMR